MYITKRDGSLEAFSLEKIINAIEKAYKSTYGDVCDSDICVIINYLDKNYSGELTSVESIQDCIEKSLMECGFSNVAKNYILYRKKRENIRLSKTKVNRVFDEILKSNGSDISRENANVDGNAPMGLMLQFGSELEKDYVTRNLISEKFVDLHNEGFFHIHDLNFYACTFNCCHIDLETLFKNGFDTGDGHIRRPKSIQSATSLAAIVIQSNQNDMFGGQGIPMFEYNLAPYVAVSFAKRLKECLEILLGVDNLDVVQDICKNIYNENGSLLDNLDKVKWFINYHFNTEDKTSRIVDKALSLTDRDTYQAMEGFIHNMNSLHSRCLPEDEEVITLNIKHTRDVDKMADIEKDALKSLIIELYKDKTISDVAKELNISRKIMSNIFCKLRIHKRNRHEASKFISKRYNEMYGVMNPMQLESVKNKVRNTQFEKYGCFGFNTDKQKETNLKRYGCENTMSSELVKEKLKLNNLKKYGCTCTLHVPEVKEKTKRTNIERYGCENVLCKNSPIRNKISYEKSEEHKRKIKETRIKKYGGEFSDSPIIKEKIISTCMKRYGLEYYPLMNHAEHTSIKQKEIFDYISNKFIDLDIQLNTISLIKEHKTLQIDIWIPQIRLGIEYNGIYWHDKNLYLNDLKENTIKSKERLKEYYATINNFTLIHVWEDDYLSDSAKILNMITDIIENLLKE